MTPSPFSYNGIRTQFYSEEGQHTAHIHAYYSGKQYGMKVELYLKDKKVVGTQIKRLPKHKQFPPAQLRDLTRLVKHYKQQMADAWVNSKYWNMKVPAVIVHKKLK